MLMRQSGVFRMKLPVFSFTFLAFVHQINAKPTEPGCSKRGLELACPMDTRVAITEPKFTPCDYTSQGSQGENAMWSQCNLRQGCGFEGMFRSELDVSYKCVPYIPGYVHDMCTAHVTNSPFLYLSSPHYATPANKQAPCICGAFMTQPTNITIYISNHLLDDQELSIEIDGSTFIHVTMDTPGREYGKISRTVKTFIRFGFVNGNPRMAGDFLLLYEIGGDRKIQFVCEEVPILADVPIPRKPATTTNHPPLLPGLITPTWPSLTTKAVDSESTGGILGAVIPVALLIMVAVLVAIFFFRRRKGRPKKKIVSSTPLNPTITNNLENLRRADCPSNPDFKVNQTYGLMERDNLIGSTTAAPDHREPKEYHYACVDLEEAKYVNDVGDRKYANLNEETRFTPGRPQSASGDVAIGGAKGSRRRNGPVPTPRTLRSSENNPSHFYSNLEKADYIKRTNLEREELMKENSLFQEIRQTLKDRAKGVTPVPTPRRSKRVCGPECSNHPDPSPERDTLQSVSSSGCQDVDTFHLDDIDQLIASGYDLCGDFSHHQAALDDQAEYQPIEFSPGNNGDVCGATSADDTTYNETGGEMAQTECGMKDNDIYEPADQVGDGRFAGEDDVHFGDEYQPVAVSAGEVEAIIKENDLYQPLNICNQTYSKRT